MNIQSYNWRIRIVEARLSPKFQGGNQLSVMQNELILTLANHVM